MTMLDDDRLAALFDLAAATFEVPASGAAEILARATSAEGDGPDEGPSVMAPQGRSRRLVATAGRHRVLWVAACLVLALVVAGVIGAAVRAPSTPTIASSKAPPTTPLRVPSAAPSTTVPGQGSAGDATGAAAPARGYSSQAAGSSNQSSAPALPSGAVGQSAKIEQTGTLTLTVGRSSVAHTMTRLTALAAANGGFVANSQTDNGTSGGAPTGTITLQVPVGSFGTVVKQAERYGKASDLATKATDVTGQYVDLQARLNALEASRQQYFTILAKATSIGDILSVQEQLDGIQSQIEQLQGQLQELTSETSYSTFTITVNASAPTPEPNPLPASGFVQAWHDSVGGFAAGVDGAVRLAGPFLFALLCLAIVGVGGRVLWRRYQRHRL
jgi:hypothetical protein